MSYVRRELSLVEDHQGLPHSKGQVACQNASSCWTTWSPRWLACQICIHNALSVTNPSKIATLLVSSLTSAWLQVTWFPRTFSVFRCFWQYQILESGSFLWRSFFFIFEKLKFSSKSIRCPVNSVHIYICMHKPAHIWILTVRRNRKKIPLPTRNGSHVHELIPPRKFENLDARKQILQP